LHECRTDPDKGHFGDVVLDGLGAALLYAWPGPIYEGNGECQAIIDERADSQQRDALATVLYGGETDEGATHWWVYRMMSSTAHRIRREHRASHCACGDS
jgi:hypothetical protein